MVVGRGQNGKSSGRNEESRWSEAKEVPSGDSRPFIASLRHKNKKDSPSTCVTNRTLKWAPEEFEMDPEQVAEEGVEEKNEEMRSRACGGQLMTSFLIRLIYSNQSSLRN